MSFKIQKGLIVQKIDDKTVVFDAEKSILYTLNETAAYIFQKLKRGDDKEKIINQMIKRYRVKKERLEKDFDELIDNLKKKKIIKES